jgi:hypothetical protein
VPTDEPSINVIIDHLVPTQISADTGIFELSTLMSLETGLNHIAMTVWQKEEPLRRRDGAAKRAAHPGTDPREARLLESYFHWFGVSLCTYVNLVGLLASLNSGAASRKDLKNKAGRKRIAAACKAYVTGISEIKDVLIWRSKVAGHFAMTDPREDDNHVVTLDMSAMHPISLLARRYHVRQWNLGHNASGGPMYEFPPWSITEVYERLAPRYWPSFRWPEAETLTAPRSPAERPSR